MGSTQAITGKVRISYEHLLKPWANNPAAEPKYSCTILIPKGDIKTLQAVNAAIEAAKATGREKWGSSWPPQVPTPLHDGDGARENGLPFGEECRGHWVMTASSKRKQDVVDAAVQPILDASEVYSGMYARVNVNFFAYNAAGRRGIGCGLGPVQKLADGEPLGGGAISADQVFTAVDPQPAYQPQATAWGDIDPITGLPRAPLAGL